MTPANEEELSPAAVSSVQAEVRKQEKRQLCVCVCGVLKKKKNPVVPPEEM